MRETIAIVICLLAVCITVTLSYLFAVRHNAPTIQSAQGNVETPTVTTTNAEGRRVFEQQKCQNCHSVEGLGNPRYPLDGIGAWLNSEEVRSWITGTGIAEEKLSPSIRQRKERYRALSEEEMVPLVEYLMTLR